MAEFIQAYPYLFANILTTTFLLAVGRRVLTRLQWQAMMLTGLANAPCFGFLVFLEGEYWNPVRLGGMALGIEDVLCSFAVAAMVWFVIGLYFKERIAFNFQWKTLFVRYYILATISVATFMILYWLKISGMTSLIVACFIVAIVLFMLQKSLWPVVLVGAVGFPLFYLCVVRLYFIMWPDFVQQWNLSTIWGQLFWGIPLGEIAWSVVFGAYWPLFTMFMANGHLKGNLKADITKRCL